MKFLVIPLNINDAVKIIQTPLERMTEEEAKKLGLLVDKLPEHPDNNKKYYIKYNQEKGLYCKEMI